MVISEKIENDLHTESPAYTIARTRSTSSLANHDMGLSTIIANINRDANRQVLNTFVCSTVERLRTWDSKILVSNPN